MSRTFTEGAFLRCSSCGEHKPAASFSFSDQSRNELNSYCRVCHAAYRHAHYLANKPDYIRRAIAQVRERRERNRREVLIYLSTHPCVDCGTTNVLILEFDHRDPSSKLASVAKLMVNRRWPRVLSEIEKCDVRCVNCHRRKTGREFRWAKVVSD